MFVLFTTLRPCHESLPVFLIGSLVLLRHIHFGRCLKLCRNPFTSEDHLLCCVTHCQQIMDMCHSVSTRSWIYATHCQHDHGYVSLSVNRIMDMCHSVPTRPWICVTQCQHDHRCVTQCQHDHGYMSLSTNTIMYMCHSVSTPSWTFVTQCQHDHGYVSFSVNTIMAILLVKNNQRNTLLYWRNACNKQYH